MHRLVLAASLLLLPACAAEAGEVPPPVCSWPAVLAQLREALRQAGRPLVFDPVPVAETSDLPGRVVTCAAQAHVIAYDAARYGQRPLQLPFIVRYALELRRNGIFLRLL